MVTLTSELTEGQVVYELRQAVAGLEALVTQLRRGDLEVLDRIRFLLSETEPLSQALRNEVTRLESKDFDLGRKNRLFHEVTYGDIGSGWGGGWDE